MINILNKCDAQVQAHIMCEVEVGELLPQDFQYYDKDGFELNVAERKFYENMGFPLNPILNHPCWQEQWYSLHDGDLVLDHCMILHRCGYAGQARDQLKNLLKEIPLAQLLLQTKPKWGYDFALDAISPTGEVYEVLHIEQDDVIFDEFVKRKSEFEVIIESTDWKDVAKRIWQRREEWLNLKGFEQNNWKSNFILGWTKAEATEKCIQ